MVLYCFDDISLNSQLFFFADSRHSVGASVAVLFLVINWFDLTGFFLQFLKLRKRKIITDGLVFSSPVWSGLQLISSHINQILKH